MEKEKQARTALRRVDSEFPRVPEASRPLEVIKLAQRRPCPSLKRDILNFTCSVRICRHNDYGIVTAISKPTLATFVVLAFLTLSASEISGFALALDIPATSFIFIRKIIDEEVIVVRTEDNR